MNEDLIWPIQTALPHSHSRFCSLDGLWNAPLQLPDNKSNETNNKEDDNDDHDDASMDSFWFDGTTTTAVFDTVEEQDRAVLTAATFADMNRTTGTDTGTGPGPGTSIITALPIPRLPLPFPALSRDQEAVSLARFPEMNNHSNSSSNNNNNHKARLASGTSLHNLRWFPTPTPLSCPSSASLVLPSSSSSSSSSSISADSSNSSGNRNSVCYYPSKNSYNTCGDPSLSELLHAKHRTMQQLLAQQQCHGSALDSSNNNSNNHSSGSSNSSNSSSNNNNIRPVVPVSTYGCKPSSFLRAALHKVDTVSDLDLDGSNSSCSSSLSHLLPPHKKRKKGGNGHNDDDDDNDATKPGVPPSTPLHSAVVRINVTAKEIDLLLRQNAKFASVSAVLPPIQTHVMDPLTRTLQPKVLPQPYTYPLHLAIYHKASIDIIQMLISAAPSVLLLRDGPNQETPLLLLLKKHQTLPYSSSSDLIQLIDAMLLKNPKCALLPDRHLNTALHTACAYGIVSVDIVRHLFIVYPHALWKCNQNGQTPLQLAQRRTVTSPEDVAVFLRDKQCRFGNKDYYA